jgi:hypothetical protein
MNKQPVSSTEAKKHHLVTSAAALANWHAALLGLTNMRPGIETPKEVRDGDAQP